MLFSPIRLALTLAPCSAKIWDMNLGDSMNLDGFTDPQCQALLDLLVLGMYADGHLALAEDARLKALLSAMGWETAHDQNQQLDAAITRVRQSAQTPDTAAAHATRLAQSFTTPQHRRQVYNWLQDLLSSDHQVAPQEGHFLSVVKGVLNL
jgi:uncharacterized tellurite resistance protein B-like protein